MKKELQILLADDDHDDRYFFTKALNQLTISTTLVTVNDGEKLIDHLLRTIETPPDVLFLDINMPRMKGSECLKEIKSSRNIKEFPVIIYSTSITDSMVDELYENGAYNCLRKGEFSMLVKSLEYLLEQIVGDNLNRPNKEHFIFQLQAV